MTETSNRSAGMVKTCIVVPCYNEEIRLPSDAFLTFALENPDINFLFVNDGSKDNTLLMLEALCSNAPDRLSLLNLVQNSGKAEAVRQGMMHVIQDIKPQYAGFWDADLATPLDAIPDFINKLIEVDSLQMVFGARVRLLGRLVKRKSSRHYLGRLFATVVSVVLKLPVYDTQCGAKLFRVTPLLSELMKEPFLSRWIFDVEIIARTIRVNHGDRKLVEDSIFELPLKKWDDVAGSKLHPADFLLATLDIYHIHRKYLV